MSFKCSNCGKEMDTDGRAAANAEIFGSNIYACPYCGKAHIVRRSVVVRAIPITTNRKKDEWGNDIKL